MYIKTRTVQQGEIFNKIFTDCWNKKNWDIINLDTISGVSKYVVFNDSQVPFGVFATKVFNLNEDALAEDVFSLKEVSMLQDTTKKIVELDCFSILPEFNGLRNFTKLLKAVLDVVDNEEVDLLCGLLEPKLFKTLQRMYKDSVMEIKTDYEVIDKEDNAKWIPFVIDCKQILKSTKQTFTNEEKIS